MSTLDSSGARLSPDDRYELASRAQSQQRLNYPRHLIVLGLGLVVVSVIVLVVAWQARGGAEKNNARRARELVQIQALIEEINTLKGAQADSAQQDLFQPLPGILSQLQSYGRQAGLANDVGLPKNGGSRPEGNAILRTYPYTVRDPSLAHLLDWISISQRQIPGLEVRELSLQPSNQLWTLTVVLSRYERNQ